MAFVASYLDEHLNAKQVDLIVDETLAYLRTRSTVLTDAAPVREYSDRQFLGLLVNELNPVASIVGYGQELPTVSFGTFDKITAEMCKIGISRLYDEKTQWKMYEAMRLANLQGITIQDQLLPAGANNDLASFLFGSISKLVSSVMDRFDSLSWDALTFGEIDITDPRTNIPVQIDYKDNAAPWTPLHFPPALTAVGSAVSTDNVWRDIANANGIQNMYNATDVYIDTNGYPVDYYVMSRKLRNLLMQQEFTKDAATSVRGTSVGAVSIDMLNMVLESRTIPKVVIVDDRYQLEDENKNIVNTRFLNEDYFVGIKKDMGTRAIGPTMESSPVTVGDSSTLPQPRTGIYVTTYEKNKNALLDVTFAVMTGLPIFLNSKLFYSRKVNDGDFSPII